jgi:hypothetical protein
MRLQSGDIVRFKHEHGIAGLHEVVAIADPEGVEVTNGECDNERYAYNNWLIFVCSGEDRKDI